MTHIMVGMHRVVHVLKNSFSVKRVSFVIQGVFNS